MIEHTVNDLSTFPTPLYFQTKSDPLLSFNTRNNPLRHEFKQRFLLGMVFSSYPSRSRHDIRVVGLRERTATRTTLWMLKKYIMSGKKPQSATRVNPLATLIGLILLKLGNLLKLYENARFFLVWNEAKTHVQSKNGTGRVNRKTQNIVDDRTVIHPQIFELYLSWLAGTDLILRSEILNAIFVGCS